MKIIIDGKTYLLTVKETHMTPDKKFVDEWIPLEVWSEIIRKKAVSSIYHIEEILSNLTGTTVRLSEDYPEAKKPLLDLNGSIGRLPENLRIEILEYDCGDENG